MITAPISLIVVAEGESATCTCVATGVPAPKVSWHYKGRTVSSREGKILVNSLSGHGTLTIFNAEQVDSGDYICKMRNNRVRKVVAPSCTIQVRGKSLEAF